MSAHPQPTTPQATGTPLEVTREGAIATLRFSRPEACLLYTSDAADE